MMLRVAAFAALLAVASANCPKVLSNSALFGTKCGAAVDHQAHRAGWITKLNVYYSGSCITGIKATYGYNAKDAQLLGKAGGQEKDIKLRPQAGEFISKADVTASGCVEALTLTTTKGRTLSVGKPGKGKALALAAPGGAHLYALKGFFGKDCAAPALSFVWATEACPPEAITGAETVEAPATAAEAVEAPAATASEIESPVEAVAEAPAEATDATPADAAPACQPFVIYSGSAGLACDLTTGKVVATGVFAKFSPFLSFACVDLKECGDAKPASTTPGLAPCKWAVCKPKHDLPFAFPHHALGIPATLSVPVFGTSPGEEGASPLAASLIPKVPKVEIWEKPNITALTHPFPDVQLPDLSALAAKVPHNLTDLAGLATPLTNKLAPLAGAAQGLSKPLVDKLTPLVGAAQGLSDKLRNISKPDFSALAKALQGKIPHFELGAKPKLEFPHIPSVQIPTFDLAGAAKPLTDKLSGLAAKIPNITSIEVPQFHIPAINHPLKQ